LISAFAGRRGAVLAQLAIGERENELTQALPLLRQIHLNDVVVTGDALFAQRAVCTHIVEQGGQYMVEVDHVAHAFSPPPAKVALPHPPTPLDRKSQA
jgi:predicted transposase YbfD/YdcC